MRIKIDNIEQSNFYKMPKAIYNFGLKPIDRELYMLCMDNWRLSVKNNWINKNGEVYFFASQVELSKQMNVDKTTIIKSFEKLLEAGLLEVEKEAGKPNKYFLINLEKIGVAEKSNQLENPTTPVGNSNQYQLENPTTPVGNSNPNKNNNKNKKTKTSSKNNTQGENEFSQACAEITDKWISAAVDFDLSGKQLKLNTDRKKKIKTLLKTYKVEEIVQAIDTIYVSKFLRGENKNGWKPTFDWIIKPANIVKVLEGNYDDKLETYQEDQQNNYAKKQQNEEFTGITEESFREFWEGF